MRGSTALLDAVGRTIDKIGNAQKHTAEEERAEKVMFVITTDGMENCSREYGYNKVRQKIERQKEKYGWEFIFLGANIDAVETAALADRAANYHADPEGIHLNYAVVSDAVCCFHANAAPISADWKKGIDEDYEKRGGKKKKDSK